MSKLVKYGAVEWWSDGKSQNSNTPTLRWVRAGDAISSHKKIFFLPSLTLINLH
jgi:hypothetical protein